MSEYIPQLETKDDFEKLVNGLRDAFNPALRGVEE